ncbi:hypothetical protein VNO78_13435 [Psophocarpus tetragonolobus]|uniref:F-box domain-containing protein n=1 Tax=Psophocarpus tetragonolobus TaxID=3891 RepID=A0AAN9SRZ3_PSOTE
MDSIRRPVKKKQKLNNEDKDIISNPPDFIIGHILSFLPTKYAVRTCVLSKRWICFWTSITKLHLEDRESRSYQKIKKTPFQKLVYRVLSLNTSNIQSFSLSLSETHAPCHVNKWISQVLNRKVKEVYINSKEKINISPHSRLKTQSLEVLVLKMNGWAISVPTLVSLSHLTVLKCSGITFTCDSSNGSEDLILNLPVLRKYEEENCSWLKLKGVTFNVPLLECYLI